MARWGKTIVRTGRGNRAATATAIGLLIAGPSALAIHAPAARANIAPQAFEDSGRPHRGCA